MRTELLSQVYAALAQFTSASRLYELRLPKTEEIAGGGLLVEAFLADDGLQELARREVIALSTSAAIDLRSLLGQPATFLASLADGGRSAFHGYVSQAGLLGSEGGFARYRLRISSWLWLLTQVRNSRVWQDKSVAEIVDEVFEAHAPYANWQWSEDARACLADIPPRSYCCQYRESDYDFVRRLLSEEGIAWRLQDGEEVQTLMLFADSREITATPEDASSKSGFGLRYHSARALEKADAIQSLRRQRSLLAGSVSIYSYDYKAKSLIGTTVPTCISDFGKHAQLPESFDYPGQYAFTDGDDAQRYALLQMQAREARSQPWEVRSTVRTLRAGTRFKLVNGPLDLGEHENEYVITRVASVGINNLPVAARNGLAELFGPIPELLEQLAAPFTGIVSDLPALLTQANSTGYANCSQALPATVPWRP
ncbi:type VI secretion system Vgr family protein, partial [Pseudoduganella violaceinigra]|uniref:type VI secretion system Vgr family protein n=1 Tax=Pseudoduganella violaceinigra TaxID=246602 RepID=UPI000488ECE0